jgi:hypothetical protein
VLEEFFGCNDHLFLLMIHSADNLPGGILPQCAKYARRSHASSRAIAFGLPRSA